MKKKTGVISLLLAFVSWLFFLLLNPIYGSLNLYYYLLIPTLTSFILGVMSFSKISSKSSLLISILSLILSIVLGLLLGGLLMVGEILHLS
ncbi:MULTISPECIES: hypothetical protein [unclassified Paenibacillus]|uniref:hypothetical protein n=1 Tax=unclassified Paenibacillus TaxID=185978 RepID=UPI0024064CE1|nr:MULTISPECIES: hypothetical protein [unclassified Paenibacillus]MDF9844556.1 cellulose synthase/poly-beta-1,6-N-acetylglucosamine synthase-like glycosyltransferase [Paenibacillus sp. PastF-2]MDF9851159.1 cellulose synthase/poly-beta-1,6-N-acetylglucosamine synthase-like glycosyltransferase [Paenibacillus sp. PastM-2]MDF9856206.1 cellulose synthase/poly-beta-1,6-N-acetylglucosamine synthase-like glycosyltransferase [Paenibacillus sp. PastF-1]MDH6481565.1 cellulose synthase/poly-beta-1,6-N-acet